MVFNWFRRQFDENKSNEDQVSSEEKPVDQSSSESSTPETQDSTTPETSSQPSQEALLSWAKAAYVNIQQRESAEPIVEPTPATQLETEQPTALPEDIQLDLASETPKAEPVAEVELELLTSNLTEVPVEPIAPTDEVATTAPSTSSTDEITKQLINQLEISDPQPTSETLAEAVIHQIEQVAEVQGDSDLQPEQIESLAELNPASFTYSQSEVSETTPEVTTLELQLEQSEVIASAQLEDGVVIEPQTEDQSELTATTAVIELSTEQVETAAENLTPETTEEFIPFWAQSEADRQARIAALAATAIEEAEPESVVTPTATKSEVATTISDPEFQLDESFLWSAEVLAAQGRRPQDISLEEITWLKRLRQGLDKTRLTLVNQLKALVGQGPLDADSVDDIESLLLQADVGVKATDEIIKALQTKLRNEVLPPDEAIAFLKQILRDMLNAPLTNGKHNFSRNLVPEKNQLNIWLVTGVNGAGKTTTIGKIAHLAQKSGYSTLIAAADTFRAAAVQQVQVWGDRAQVEVIANTGKNTDPAAVVFDAITAAQARGTELLLVDTAGRLQNKKNLMDELSKIRRIVDKKSAGATVESLLVLDATLGQNGLRQAEVFSQSAGISGVVLTKLDGTAKGGVALAVVQQLNLPIRFIGAGEGIEDLRPFSSYEFVEALLSN